MPWGQWLGRELPYTSVPSCFHLHREGTHNIRERAARKIAFNFYIYSTGNWKLFVPLLSDRLFRTSSSRFGSIGSCGLSMLNAGWSGFGPRPPRLAAIEVGRL